MGVCEQFCQRQIPAFQKHLRITTKPLAWEKKDR
jgi:hypothetical protein